MAIFDILLNRPLGALMYFLYNIFNNYAVAIFFFALVVKIILLPLGIKQQNNQIKMAKIRPKEMAIRGKYAGRTDSVTQQKMQQEIMAMHKTEGYNQLAGCLPLLVQLPVLFSLFRIIRNPLTFISRLDETVIEGIQEFIYRNIDKYSEVVPALGRIGEKFENIQQISIIEIFNNPVWFAEIKAGVEGLPADFQNIDYGFFGQMLTSPPSQAIFSVLILIPILNFATSFLQMRLQKKINSATQSQEVKGMKFMEYSMPLLIVWMAFSMEAALGLYWVFQSVLGMVQMIILAKLIPLPNITEEEYELARQQYGASPAKKKKKKKKPAAELEESDDAGEDGSDVPQESEEAEDGDPDPDAPVLKDDAAKKYISKTIPKGINPAVKNNYDKTGKKYKIKKRKK